MHPTAQLLKLSTIIEAFNEILSDNNSPFSIKRIFTEVDSYPALLLESSSETITSEKHALPIVEASLSFSLYDNSRSFEENEEYMVRLFPLIHQKVDELQAKLTSTKVLSVEVTSINRSYTVNEKDSVLKTAFIVTFQYEQLMA